MVGIRNRFLSPPKKNKLMVGGEKKMTLLFFNFLSQKRYWFLLIFLYAFLFLKKLLHSLKSITMQYDKHEKTLGMLSQNRWKRQITSWKVIFWKKRRKKGDILYVFKSFIMSIVFITKYRHGMFLYLRQSYFLNLKIFLTKNHFWMR